MTALDWIIVAILFLSVLLATAQGFVYELFSLAGSVARLSAGGLELQALWRVAVALRQERVDRPGRCLSVDFYLHCFSGRSGRPTGAVGGARSWIAMV